MTPTKEQFYWQIYFVLYWFSLENHFLMGHRFHNKFTKAWLKSRNPSLGNSTPLELIKNNRGRKVLEFIKGSFEDANYWSRK
jgi:hypothetical protein